MHLLLGPVLGDVDRPLPAGVLLLIVVDELRLHLVVAASKHARRCGLRL